MGSFGTAEILLVLIAVIVLFGAKRLPTAARSLGQSMRIFKAETKGLRQDDEVVVPSQQIPAAAAGMAETSEATDPHAAPRP